MSSLWEAVKNIAWVKNIYWHYFIFWNVYGHGIAASVVAGVIYNLDGDNRIRVIEFHYDLNNVLQGFKMFKFDGSPKGAVFGGIADRSLPIGPNKITVPGSKKEDRKQTRYAAEMRKMEV